MKQNEILEHWRNWAIAHGTDIHATTKTATVKMLEVDALSRRLSTMGYLERPCRTLEVGCGNGQNCIALGASFPLMRIDGIDYVPEMVTAAVENAAATDLSERVAFFRGDVLELATHTALADTYDVVLSDRCLINLPTVDLQLQGIHQMAAKVRPGGHLLMIENSQQTHSLQNHYRTLLGLSPRTPAAFNLFFDETKILPYLDAIGLEVAVEDFVSLHDLLLYVLIPAVNGGELDYDHPLVEAATRLSMAVSAETPSPFGACGQNRLYCCHKVVAGQRA